MGKLQKVQLETKARFISQVMTGEVAVRRAEDIGGQELSYAEVKAIASGNPAVLTLAEADAELQRLAVLRKNHADEQYLARRYRRELPETISQLTKRAGDLEADQATAAAHADDPIVIGDRPCSRDQVLDRLAARLNTVPDTVRETKRYPLGRYRGLEFGIVLHPGGAADVYLEGAATRHGMLSRDHHGPRAVLNALERLSDSYGGQLATARRRTGRTHQGPEIVAQHRHHARASPHPQRFRRRGDHRPHPQANRDADRRRADARSRKCPADRASDRCHACGSTRVSRSGDSRNAPARTGRAVRPDAGDRK